jgi:hypothetical protein
MECPPLPFDFNQNVNVQTKAVVAELHSLLFSIDYHIYVCDI